ncbi:MAG: M24 family metallopeptidase [Pirellulaceae bacterium]|nr:M24 family metallopeptidase [Pirellulaceae bacterium]
MTLSPWQARIMAGIPSLNAALYRRIRFLVGDPVSIIEIGGDAGTVTSTLILRDIEIERAKAKARADAFACPKDFEPATGLSGDRETATAQATAECLLRNGVNSVVADRSLPLIFAEFIRRAGIEIICDTEWGVIERRQKDDQELEFIEKAQNITELVMKRACETVANAVPDRLGQLTLNGELLSSESLRAKIDQWLIEQAYSNPGSIVACGPMGADCHEHGHGPLVTEQPIIIDIFPRDKSTLYNGDCTRTVVNGKISERIQKMHAAVVAAKGAATATVKPGVTGHAVDLITAETIRSHGFSMGLPSTDDNDDYTAMTHGTGHGVGLEVHEPPLLASGGVELLVGDVVMIEPGLYCRAVGGVRVEDMVVVTEDGCRNLNRLPEGLDWRD